MLLVPNKSIDPTESLSAMVFMPLVALHQIMHVSHPSKSVNRVKVILDKTIVH
jgi:hypothetical protein